jgi:hypothetical protein
MAVLLAAVGCSEESEPTGSGGGGAGPPTPQECAIGDRVAGDGTCCAPGTKPGSEGCTPAGILVCGAGFDSDDTGGCVALGPAAACPDGQVALPGETACHELMDCGQGQWGNIPVDASTQYVDASAVGGDGSATAPWTTIQAGVDAAASGAVVAVDAGQYLEELNIGNLLRDRGRCPSMVELVGQGAVGAIIIINAASTGGVVGGMAVTGPGIGIVAFGPDDFLLDAVWVHDTGGRGIDFEDNGGVTAGVVSGSLVERTRDASVIVLSASLTLRDSVIRDALPGGPMGLARGLVVKHNASTSERGSAVVERSIIERVANIGILTEYSDLEVIDSIIRDISPNAASNAFGRGIEIQGSPLTDEQSIATIRGSVIERAFEDGILIDGSVVSIENTVVRDIWPAADTAEEGVAIELQIGLTIPSNVTVTTSLVERSTSAGIAVLASDLTVDGVLVRDIAPGFSGQVDGFGIGIGLQDDLQSPQRSTATIRDSAILRTIGLGLRNQGSDMTLEGVSVIDTFPTESGTFGHGISFLDTDVTVQPATGTIYATGVERAHDVGIVVASSSALVENTVVRDTLPKLATGEHGYGIGIQRPVLGSPFTSATLRDVLVENVIAVGVLALNAELFAERLQVIGVAVQASDGLYGDGIVYTALSHGDIRDSYIEGAARAGVANFGSEMSMGTTTLECNDIQLAGQDLLATPFTFTDAGDNHCGCGKQTDDCKVLSANLLPPAAVE